MSCGSDFGHKIIGDEFTVYFTDVEDQNLAEEVANYFKDNELISNQKQDVQLVRLKNKIQLRLIANDPESCSRMSFEERKLLTDLQTKLYNEVIEEPFELVLCNNKFEPKLNLNE